ncbi:MAG: hypothetical protein ACD_76C00139G0005 [uncultured bacterium]|nr:MAG: hypothetical protein ACD_76C00139G0005 [uncultured bacterium]HBD05521.1 hypothetical protein [Candidatus Uhrbacteria bacterium]
MFLRIFFGLLIAAIGFSMTWKTEWYLSIFGRVEWAERHLGVEGGTRLFYKLLGIVVVIIGVFLAANLLGDILIGTIGRFFGAT